MRWSGRPEDRQGDWVFVQPLDPETGAPQGEPGWVRGSAVGTGSRGTAGWPEGQNQRAAQLVQRYFAEGLPGRGAHRCALALREELGIHEGMGDAHVAWRSYLKKGWRLRDDYIKPGDLVFYVPGHSRHYVSQPEGHVGVAVLHQGKLQLLSHITGRDGVGRWRITPLHDPTYALYEP